MKLYKKLYLNFRSLLGAHDMEVAVLYLWIGEL